MTPLRIAVREFADFENALAEEIDLYRKLHPEVTFEAVPLDLHRLYSELLAEGGLRSGTWDIGYVVTDWLAEASEGNSLEDLTPYIRRKPVPDWPDGWARSIVEPLYLGEKLFTLPWHDGPECLIYRKDLFEDAREQKAFRDHYGYALKPPTTWEQFADIARYFTRAAQGLYGTVFAAFPDGHNTLYDFAIQIWSRGGEFEDKDGNAVLDTAEAAAALDFYRDTILDARRCYPGARELDSTRSGDLFLAGSVAMMVNWFGFATRCDRPDSQLQGNVAIAPIPSAGGNPPVSLSVFWTLGIGAGSKQKQAAFDFLHFLTQPECDKGIVRHGAVGVRLSTWRSPEVQKQAPAYGKIEEISLRARSLPRNRNLPAFAAIVNEVATAALTTDEPSPDILKKAQQHITERRITFR